MVKKCKHIFQMAHGSCFSGTVSYHGKCKNCEIEMSVYGKIDEEGHGKLTISAVDGFKKEKKV